MDKNNLSSDYDNAGYNKRLGFGDTPALILVDFVMAYFEPNSPLFASVEKNLESAIKVLEQARLSKIPVIYTNVVFQKGGWNGGMFIEKVPALHMMEDGGELGKWADGLNPLDTELVISKQYPSAFFGTSLASSLNAAKVDTLIITGVTTSGCIRATCIDTVSYGFRPIIVEDAVGDRDERPHEANLFDMNAKYGDVVSENEVIEYLKKFNN